MKIHRNRTKSTTITFILALTLVATMIISVPITFSQLKISMTASVWQDFDPVGLGQTVLIEGLVFPRPPTYGDIYEDLDFTITKPDGSTETVLKDSDIRAEASFEIVCDQLGSWGVTLNWAGDELHESPGAATTTWTVQEEPVPSPEKLVTYARVSTVPTTVGVGQYIYIVGWITPPREINGGIYPVTFTITKPDGSTDTRVMDTDSPATASFGYLCDQSGTWGVKLSYAGDQLHTNCESTTWQWTVEEEPVDITWPDEPLPDPNMQWKWPISSEYREWYQISGPWTNDRYNASGCYFNPYSKAPDTPHVLWKFEPRPGGLMGGETGHLAARRGFPSVVAAHGRLYYTTSEPYITSEGPGATHPVLHCLDQFTAEEIWASDLPGTGSGSEVAIEISTSLKVDPKIGERPPDVFSVWVSGGSIWEVDAWTGTTLYYWEGAETCTIGRGYVDGALYLRNYPSGGLLTKWDCRSKEIVWTKELEGYPDLYNRPTHSGGTLTDRRSSRGGIPYTVSINTWNETTGELIVEGPDTGAYSAESHGRIVTAYGKYYFHCSTDKRLYALSLTTGEVVWRSDPWEGPWGTFAVYTEAAAYGNVYFRGWNGYLYCYDGETGEEKWKFYCGDTSETAMGAYVPHGPPVVADGKIYFATGEHTPPNPLPRGNTLFCVDAYTGDLIWSIPTLNTHRSGGISSGILWYPNEYDGCFYGFGKGPTATTVSVQQDVIATGESVLIKGTVTDQSAGAKGTPAIADEDMSEWMQYLYMNKPEPDAKGVDVALVAIGSDGTVYEIAHARSTSSGQFSYLWQPPKQDTYRIVANFFGSGSYYSSWGEDAVAVTPAPPTGGPIEPEPPTSAPPTSAPPTSAPPPTEEAPLISTEAAVAVAVAVVAVIGAAAYWVLRKRRQK